MSDFKTRMCGLFIFMTWASALNAEKNHAVRDTSIIEKAVCDALASHGPSKPVRTDEIVGTKADTKMDRKCLIEKQICLPVASSFIITDGRMHDIAIIGRYGNACLAYRQGKYKECRAELDSLTKTSKALEGISVIFNRINQNNLVDLDAAVWLLETICIYLNSDGSLEPYFKIVRSKEATYPWMRDILTCLDSK